MRKADVLTVLLLPVLIPIMLLAWAMREDKRERDRARAGDHWYPYHDNDPGVDVDDVIDEDERTP